MSSHHIYTTLYKISPSLPSQKFTKVCKLLSNIGMCKNKQSVMNSIMSNLINYRIMQIVCGGKVSRLHDLVVIRGKTFAII